MTTYTLHSCIPCQAAINKALASAGAERRVALGLDLELATPACAITVGGGTPLYLGKQPRSVWIELVRWLVAQGCEVYAVQEACGFGWEFHRDLQSAGARSHVVAPQEMNGKRKTDKRDARALATLLWDYEARSNRECLRVVRMPTPQQQQQRGYHRNRSQWLKMRCQMEAQGRSLMWDHSWLEVPKGWWRPRIWEVLRAQLCAALHEWLVKMLEPMQSLCVSMAARVEELEKQAVTTKPVQPAAPEQESPQSPPAGDSSSRTGNVLPRHLRPKGLGDLCYATLNAEVLDWSRFKNRGQAGSFIGCCPREHSSGSRQKLGEIDRMGNARLRAVLVEAAWRLRKWSPQWRGFRKFGQVLETGSKASGASKRKAIVACARLLMVDLWRLHVGTATLEGLGLQPAQQSA